MAVQGGAPLSTLDATVLTRRWHAPCGTRSAVYIELGHYRE